MAGTIKKHDSDMTEGPVWKHIIAFSLPLLLGLVFQQLYNTVDTIVVGKFVSKEALAAVGSVGNLINVLVATSAGLASGATVLISQHYGAHDNGRLSDAVSTTVILTFIMGIISTLGGLLLSDPLLKLMDTPDDVYADAKTYLVIYFSGVTGLLLYNMASGVLRAVGDSKRPLYFLIFSALCNTVLDLVFVLVFDLGVAGVAYATILSQFLSAVLTLIALTRSKEAYGIRWRHLVFKLKELKAILAIGLPTAIQQGVTSFSNVFVQGYINILGSDVMAGWSAYSKVDGFATLPMSAISIASSTFVGQNYGAKQLKRARNGANVSLAMCLGVTIFLGAIVMIAAPFLSGWFSDDANVIYYTVFFVRLITPFYIAMSIIQIYAGALRGIGQSVIPTVIMLISYVAFRQVYLFFNKLLFAGTEIYTYGIGFAFPVGWTLCSILTLIYYRKSILCSGTDEIPVKENHPVSRFRLLREKAGLEKHSGDVD